MHFFRKPPTTGKSSQGIVELFPRAFFASAKWSRKTFAIFMNNSQILILLKVKLEKNYKNIGGD
jgi:hypothetical protein